MSRNAFLVWAISLIAGGVFWIAFPPPLSWVGNFLVLVALVIVMRSESWRAKPTSRRFSSYLILPAILSGVHAPFGDLDRYVFAAVACGVIALNAYLTFVRAE